MASNQVSKITLLELNEYTIMLLPVLPTLTTQKGIIVRQQSIHGPGVELEGIYVCTILVLLIYSNELLTLLVNFCCHYKEV